MGILKKAGGAFAALLVLLLAIHLFVQRESSRVRSFDGSPIPLSVMRGDTTTDVARHLEDARLISSKTIFLVYLFETRQWGKFVAGQYAFSGKLTFDDISQKLISGSVVPKSVRITFPEGFTAQQIANRLREHGLPGDEFLALVRSPTPVLLGKIPLLRDFPEPTPLEGFLFPDTYEFPLQASAEDIARVFLRTFEARFDDSLRLEMTVQKKSLLQVVTMASILEAEIRTESDRKLVSDLFARRLAAGMPLQSDATVRYALGIDKVKYSGVDIATNSPYNTYVNKGLPIGPIDNPGIVALRAALYPTPNGFWYFLSDPKTGETIFSKDFEEHKRNKAMHGL